MIDIALIRKDPKGTAARYARRGMKFDFADLLEADEKKRRLQTEIEAKKATRNKASEEIARMKKEKVSADKVESEIKSLKKLGEEIAKGDAQLSELERQVFDAVAALPNLTLDEVQAGGKEANKVVRTWGVKPDFKFKPKDHVELCTANGLIDYERAAKISGASTWMYTGAGAQLEWAILNYFADFHTRNGYTFVLPPHLLNYESGFAAGQFPKFTDDVFVIGTETEKTKMRFLLPTAETALLNMHRGETIPEEKLPLKYFGYTPCYRKEAGGYGAAERGMIRGHQFNKIEMFIFCKPEDSVKHLAELVRNAEQLVEGLGLHYQTVALAAGDVGAAMAKTYDIELYIPSMNGYKECSSCSNAWDYQARRANIKMRTKNGTELLHTLNASGLATSRLIPAIVEQFQLHDGTFQLPAVLKKYLLPRE